MLRAFAVSRKGAFGIPVQKAKKMVRKIAKPLDFFVKV